MKSIRLILVFLMASFLCHTQELILETGLNTAISETSGLLYLNNTLITHNDSENSNQLFEIDTATGAISRTVTISNATNIDWEDLTSDDTYIYIGDFGNYRGDRTDLKIYRVAIADYFANTTVTADIINFNYSNQTDFTPSPLATNFDAEGLIHFNDKLYVFSKNWLDGNTNIYELPKTIGSHSIAMVDTVNSAGLISGATYNNLDNSVLLCGYDVNGAFLIRLNGFNAGLFSNGTITKTTVVVPTDYSSQIEGVSPISATAYYVSAETNDGNLQGLYRFTMTGLDIEDHKVNSIGFYPNPAQNKITVQCQDCVTKIYSLSGQLLYTAKQPSLNISMLAKGIYILQIETDGNKNSTIKKLVIN